MNVDLAVKNFFPESTHHADAAANRRNAARERASQSFLLVKLLSIRGFFEVRTDFFELNNPIGDFRNHCSNDFLMGNVVAANDRVAEVRILAVIRVRMAEGGLRYSSRCRAGTAPSESALVDENHIGAALGRFDGRHAGSQAA